MQRWFSLVALAITLASPTAAQHRGSVEVGVFTRGTLFDPSLTRVTALGFGAQLGIYLGPQWLVEADGSVSSADGLAGYSNATYRPLHIRLSFLEPYADRGKLVLGVGVVSTHYGGDFDKSDHGLAGLLGLGIDLGRSLVARLDGTLDYVRSPANQAGDNWNGGLQIGVGYLFGH